MLERSFYGLSAAGFHRIAYREWEPTRPSGSTATVCVHGLTRNSHDFELLAGHLAASGRRVICPDVVGRGASAWLPNPDLYGYAQYMADMAALIARLNAGTVAWVGTSMGGLIGMLLAAQANTPISRLVVNDVGPFVPKAALERILGYVGTDPSFPTLDGVEAYLRFNLVGFGVLPDRQWARMAETSSRLRPDGTYGLNYDPAIAVPLKAQPPADVDLWPIWDRIRCPTLVLRGATSDLLTRDTAVAMEHRGPKARVVEIAQCGHAPSLMVPDQIRIVEDFLNET